MRILVLGAGAVGGYFGGRLAESGADVSFLVRDRRKAELDAHGLIVKSAVGDIAIPVVALTSREVDRPFDLVLLSCKSYDLDAAIDAIEPAMGREGAVLPVLNGVRHLDRLVDRLGARHVLGGACYISASFENGVVHHVGELQTLMLGELSGEKTARAKEIEATFARTKADVILSGDILQVMWEKLVMLAALAGTTTLTRATVGQIMAAASGEKFLLATLAECAALAAAEGHAPTAEALARARGLLVARGSPFAASTMRDMLAERRTEGEHIIGDLVRRAAQHGLVTPILEVAWTNLEVHEARLRPAG